MSKLTVGEALSRRKLKVHSDGCRYVEGQGKASKLSDEDALVSYVDRHGSLTVIPCEFSDGDWFHRGVVMIVDPHRGTIRNLRRNAPLKPMALDLLKKAYKKEEAPQPQDTTEGEPQPPQDPEG